MDREERRRKFNEAVINLLHPPPPPPPPSPPHDQDDDDQDRLATNSLRGKDFNPESVPAPDTADRDNSNSSSSSTYEDDKEERLSRAQRKRLRKKKLKESASHRREIIGPVLPGEDSVTPVRRNVAEKVGLEEIEKHGREESADGSNKTKMKQRRKAKRIAKEEAKSTSAHELNQTYPKCNAQVSG